MQFIKLQQIDSTNNFARQLLDEQPEVADFTVITTESQTSGRGQKGNSWECEDGKNLSFSIICHPTFVRPSAQYILSECIALAVQRALQRVLTDEDRFNPNDIKVKWPNDIYYKDSKISGTLIECDLMGKSVRNCIIGTGVNINQERFLSDAPNPISLSQIIGHEFNRDTILTHILSEFIHLYEMVRSGSSHSIHSAYLSSLYRNDGQYHPFIDVAAPHSTFLAKIHDVEPSGRMILHRQDATLSRYEFKEVRFVI